MTLLLPLQAAKKIPRYYQVEAIEAIEESLARVDSTLLVMATGTGKSLVAAEIARIHRSRGENILILAHTRELVEQNAKTLESVLGEQCYIEQGDLKAPHYAGVVSASFQSITQDRRLQRFGRDKFQLLIGDEIHRILAPTFRKVFDFFPCKKMGMTATPDRGDEKALGQVFDEVAYVMDIIDGIDSGYLVPVDARNVNIQEVDISHVSLSQGDLAQGELDLAILQGIEGIVQKVLELEPDSCGVLFFPGVISAEAACDRFNAIKPGSACFVHGGTDPDERRTMMSEFKAGRYQYLCQVGIAVEGFDAPRVEFIGWARPTKSRWMFAQGVGRGLRVLPGIVDHLPRQADAAQRRMLIRMSAKPNCIAEGQLVLTDVGQVPIEAVTKEMLVWDGASFVAHGGAILRGEREVIEYAGLCATEDHEVWTEEGWKAFGECAVEQVPVAVTGFGGLPVREARSLYRRGYPKERETLLNRPVYRVREGIQSRASQSRFWEGWLHEVRKTKARAEVASGEVCPCPESMYERSGQEIQRLRGQRHRVQILGAYSNGGLGNGEPGARCAATDRPSRQRWALRSWEPKALDSGTEHGAHQKYSGYAASACVQSAVPVDSLFGCDAAEASDKALVCRGGTALPQEVVKTKRRVWDILDAGPLHRFTVQGLLVHNCRLLNFVGNAGRHSLVTPEDLLGGDYTEAELKEAKKAAAAVGEGGEYDPLEALRESRARLQALVRESTSTVKATVTSFDPFKVLDVDLGEDRVGARYGVKPPTEKQVVLLRARGVDEQTLGKLDRRGAGKLLDSMRQRQEQGLASLKQMRLLGQYGIFDNSVTFDGATKAITYIKAKGWGRKGIDPDMLNRLLGRAE